MSNPVASFEDFSPRALRLVTWLQHAGRRRTLVLTLFLILATATADWRVGTEISMGLLYILPVMVAAAVLPPPIIVVLSGICATLGVVFYHPRPPMQTALHFLFALAANLLAGLFMGALIRNRQQALQHIDQLSREQILRRVTEEQLRVLAESSLAAILTLDQDGVVIAANGSANTLFGVPAGQTVVGSEMDDALPLLAEALRMARGAEPFQTAAQSRGRRRDGGIFLANTWLSTYRTPEGLRLAAIIVDSSEEMRDREERHLRQVEMTNRVTLAAITHEIRNFCSAMSLVYASLKRMAEFAVDYRFQELGNLIDGVGKIAAMKLDSTFDEFLEEVPLKQVLEDLRIIVEPDWNEMQGTLRWSVPEDIPVVLGQRHGLLQAFLNLAQNSRRAVTDCSVRELEIEVFAAKSRVTVRFRDSGTGIAHPETLFEPFKSGSLSSGMGLYISRAILRNYGGDLRFEPCEKGASFAVELEVPEYK
ncbi:MAG TPA: ATP-binding protein [Bryobacteraceae bacterium]|jgi:PAS domain S-box-containing protein